MNQRMRTCLFLGLVGFFSIQLLCTFINRSPWPFCAYNVFSTIIPDEITYSRIVLEKNTGETIEVDTGSVLPLEFFRSYNALKTRLISNPIEAEKQALAKTLLDRLNNDPWSKFDQIRSSPSKKEDESFVRFSVVQYQVNFDNYAYGEDLEKKNYTYLYQYPAP